MRKLIPAAIGVAALATIAAPAVAAFASSTSFTQATGDVTLVETGSGFTTQLSFSAFDYSNGTAKGSVTYNDTEGDISYTTPVTNAYVDPTSGTACFTYTVLNTEVIWRVTDGGSPGAGNDTTAYYYGAPGSYPSPTSLAECDAVPVSITGTVIGGNLVVH